MLKKLSLAALVAMGSMSVASATDLSEAIKGVDFGGYLRLRVYNDSDKTYTDKYRTTALFKFSVPVSEDLKFNTAYAFDWSIDSTGNTLNEVTNAPTGAAPASGNVKFFLKYSKNNLTALVGKIPVVTPITSTGVGEATAAGGIVQYKVNDSLTVAAAGLDAMVGNDKIATGGNNVYAAAAIYKSDIADVQAWFFKVDNMLDKDIVLSADVKALKDSGVAIHFDYATASGDAVTGTQSYLNLNASLKQDALCAKLGYAVTGTGGTVVLDGDSPIAAVFATEQITGIANSGDDNAIYAKVGYNVNEKTNVYGAYTTTDKSGDEVLVGAKYTYTKKFKVAAYYSIFSAPTGGTDNNEARVEFKYSF